MDGKLRPKESQTPGVASKIESSAISIEATITTLTRKDATKMIA